MVLGKDEGLNYDISAKKVGSHWCNVVKPLGKMDLLHLILSWEWRKIGKKENAPCHNKSWLGVALTSF